MSTGFFKISKFFLYLVPLMICLVLTSSLFPFIVGKYVWVRIGVDLAAIFFFLGLLFEKNAESEFIKRLKIFYKNPLVIAVSVFVLVFLLACLFGFDPKNSFWSNFERGEGGLQVLHFYVFFVLLITLLKDEKDWRTIFIFTLLGGLGMAIYGFLAGLGAQNFIGPRFNDPGFRFQGSIGNSAYVAAYALFMLFYAGYILASKYRKQLFSIGALVFWFFFALFLAVFFAAATRGAFVGLIASLVVFIGYLAFCSKRWRKWLIIGAVILVLAVILLVVFKDEGFIKSSPLARILDLSFSAKTFQDRATMWQIAIDGWKQKPIFGWGPENFLPIFDRYFNIKYFVPAQGFGAWFDRAHSIYFDSLAETGILGLLSLLGMWFVFYWQFFKKASINVDNQHQSDKISINSSKSLPAGRQEPRSVLINALIISLPVAYLVQGIVLFDVSPIYFNIFLFLAFASYKFQNLNPQNKIN